MLVALTFDDGYPSHCGIISDILRQHRFGATFFLNAEYIQTSWDRFLELHDQGFEVGNHLHKHWDFKRPHKFRRSLIQMNHLLSEHGFGDVDLMAYPGFHCDKSRMDIIRLLGFKLARGGPYWNCVSGGAGPVYDPHTHSRWNIPSTFVFGEDFGSREFTAEADLLATGTILVFHDLDSNHPMSVSTGDFVRTIDFLAKKKSEVVGLGALWDRLHA